MHKTNVQLVRQVYIVLEDNHTKEQREGRICDVFPTSISIGWGNSEDARKTAIEKNHVAKCFIGKKRYRPIEIIELCGKWPSIHLHARELTSLSRDQAWRRVENSYNKSVKVITTKRKASGPPTFSKRIENKFGSYKNAVFITPGSELDKLLLKRYNENRVRKTNMETNETK